MQLRVIDDGPLEPTFNMALDEALLLGCGPPTLRLYGWRPHAVSLGYFQRAADFADLPPQTPLVRRLTGGGAIHHGDELTFALTLPTSLLPLDIAASYELIHGAALRALASIEVTATLLRHGHLPAARPDHRWCFAVPGRGDVVVADGRKLLGSAQRRIQRPRPRVLHHGSLVLQAPPLTPFAAAVAEQATAAQQPPLRARLIVELAAALGLSPTPGAPSTDELTAARQLQTARYGNAQFTFSR